jgi:hypothetical protein
MAVACDECRVKTTMNFSCHFVMENMEVLPADVLCELNTAPGAEGKVHWHIASEGTLGECGRMRWLGYKRQSSLCNLP